nr:unnamed protein product [Callosobruchus analis]
MPRVLDAYEIFKMQLSLTTFKATLFKSWLVFIIMLIFLIVWCLPLKTQSKLYFTRLRDMNPSIFIEFIRRRWKCWLLMFLIGSALARTSISDAFYARQVSFYISCCVDMQARSPTFYTWTDDMAGRGSTEISSALVCHLDSLNFENKQ